MLAYLGILFDNFFKNNIFPKRSGAITRVFLRKKAKTQGGVKVEGAEPRKKNIFEGYFHAKIRKIN